MSDTDVLDNRPLARSAVWFLVDAAFVFFLLLGMIVASEYVTAILGEPPAVSLTIVVLAVLFTVFTLVAAALGFLSNCSPGRKAGQAAILALAFGWAAIGLMFA